MVKRSKGKMSGYTRLFGRGKRKITIADYIKTFEIGDLVYINIKKKFIAMPDLRYNNKSGKISKKQGKCYVVEIMDGKKKKYLLTSPIHIEKKDDNDD